MKKILLTGSCGFIFSNFVRKYQSHPKYNIVNVDKIVEVHNRKNILPDHKLYIGDIADEHFMNNVFSIEKPDIVLHTAAESFVDNSIASALPFVHTNIVGTQVMIDLSLKYGIERFVYTGTDECYGQLLDANDVSWTETSLIKPRNPYSASKAAGELLIFAANQTHGLNYNITRSSNNYGGYQPSRNLVPKIITSILKKQKIPIHGDGQNTREWLFVEDNCSAIMRIIEDAPLNEIYNIGSGIEYSNLEMVNIISSMLDKPAEIDFITNRKGHDKRYSVNSDKIKKLGWKPEFTFEQGMQRCIDWYLKNQNYYD